MPETTQRDARGTIRAALLAWYDTHRRDLPWRRTTDPYRVWVSEVMLQQTRVDAVIPYYERWLATFPNVGALAGADLETVLKHWEGLGYYSRARNLHSAARLVRERHGGSLPADHGALRALPGIGEYTAGAIASIAYNQRAVAIDGNMRRVLCRLFDLATPSQATLRARAALLLDPLRPGDFNQAVMDLGATVCTPRVPNCTVCPLASVCRAHARRTTHKRPAAKRRKPAPHIRVSTLITLVDDRVLLARRAQQRLLGGLWEFPAVDELPADARVLGSVTHTFTHLRMTYLAYLSRTHRPAEAQQRWVRVDELSGYPMSVAQRRLEQLIGTVDRSAALR